MNLGRRTPLCSLAEDREETVYMLDEDPPDDDQGNSHTSDLSVFNRLWKASGVTELGKVIDI